MRWWRLRDRDRDRDRLLLRGRLRLREDERLELRESCRELRDEERLRERDDRRLERPEPEVDGEAFSCGEPGHMSFTYLDVAAEDMSPSRSANATASRNYREGKRVIIQAGCAVPSARARHPRTSPSPIKRPHSP